MRQLFLGARQTLHGDLVLVNAAHALQTADGLMQLEERKAVGAQETRSTAATTGFGDVLTPALPGQPQVLLACHAAAALQRLTAAACAGGTDGPTGHFAAGEGSGPADIVPAAKETPFADACPIVAVSGYRPQSEQQAIWDDTLADKGEDFTRQFVALPGCSEHQTGLAVDLARRAEKIDFIRPDFPAGGVCGRFRALAAGYGFIQRYQSDKQAVTGIAAEPWHFRYVGAPHAQAMTQLGLCLEEYLEFLAAESAPGHPWRFVGTDGAVAVTHCPVPREGCCVPLPAGRRWQVSGTNAGGAVLTVWEEADCVR